VQRNQEIINRVMAQYQSGYNVLTDFMWTRKVPLQGTSQSVILKLNRAHGMRLRRIYHSLFHGTESSNTAYDHSAKVTSFYTQLNAQRLQDYDLVRATNDDWMLTG
jgi:hypothetical protein